MKSFSLEPITNENQAYEFLKQILHPDGLHCPRCGVALPKDQAPHTQDRAPLVNYRCRECGRVYNLFTDTLLGRFGVAQMLRRLSEAAGVEGPTNAHAFRHGFAVSYLMNDGDLTTLCDLLGHKDMSTTKQFYARFLIKHLQAKHDRHSPITNLPDDLLEG